jgi:hypothetical protein
VEIAKIVSSITNPLSGEQGVPSPQRLYRVEVRFTRSEDVSREAGSDAVRLLRFPDRDRNGITAGAYHVFGDMGVVTTITSALSRSPNSDWYVWAVFLARRPSFQKFAKTYSRKARPKPFSAKKIVIAIVFNSCMTLTGCNFPN